MRSGKQSWGWKWWLLAHLLLLLALLVVGRALVVAHPRPGARITDANAAKVREGMTREEVEAVLGPPGKYARGPVRCGPMRCGPLTGSTGYNGKFSRSLWISDEAWIQVDFDGQRRVMAWGICEVSQPTFFVKAKKWLGL